MKVIKQAGYEVVFDTFDKRGVIQRCDNNKLMTQIFTIGVRRVRK
ncbi:MULTISPECIES: mucus-binding protein [Lactobacillus]|nr:MULTISPECIES: mucus-binding protein [Lactobacillus]